MPACTYKSFFPNPPKSKFSTHSHPVAKAPFRLYLLGVFWSSAAYRGFLLKDLPEPCAHSGAQPHCLQVELSNLAPAQNLKVYFRWRIRAVFHFPCKHWLKKSSRRHQPYSGPAFGVTQEANKNIENMGIILSRDQTRSAQFCTFIVHRIWPGRN